MSTCFAQIRPPVFTRTCFPFLSTSNPSTGIWSRSTCVASLQCRFFVVQRNGMVRRFMHTSTCFIRPVLFSSKLIVHVPILRIHSWCMTWGMPTSRDPMLLTQLFRGVDVGVDNRDWSYYCFYMVMPFHRLYRQRRCC